MNRRQKLVQQQFLNNEEAVIKRLNQVYGVALKDINAKIKNLQLSIDDLQLEYDWMDDDDPKKAQVKSMIQSKIYQKKYQEALQDQVDGILKQMQTKQYLTISDYLDECYEDGFVGSLFDLHGQDVPLLMPLDQTKMVRAVQLDSKISKGLYSRLGEDVALLKKKITAQVSRSISTGTSYADCAKQLAGYTRIGYNNAIRIARTEGHRIQTTAAMDTMEGAKERGADVVKQWDSTLDGRTRESHVAMDGQIREVDEKFSNGLMYPGDPAGGAGEVINCRCALLQRARWTLDDGFSKWDNFAGKLEEFESPASYDEFKKSFFSDENRKYMNFVQRMEKQYGTKDFRKVLGLMTDREYKKYSRLLANNPVYNKKAPVKLNPEEIKKRIDDDQKRIDQINADLMGVNRDIGRHSTHIYDEGANVDKDQVNSQLKKVEGRLKELDDISDRWYNRPERGTDEYYKWREWRKTIDIDAVFNEQVKLGQEAADLSSLLRKREKYDDWIQWKKDNPLSTLESKKTTMLKQIDQLKDEINDYQKQLIQAKSTAPVTVDSFPEYFRKNSVSKKATQTFVDALNEAEDLDPNIRLLYTNIDALPNIPSDCSITYTGKDHALRRWNYAGKTTKCQLKVPKMTGEDLMGQKATAFHEIGHFIDMGMCDKGSLLSELRQDLTDAVRSSGMTIGDDIKRLFDDFQDQYRTVRDSLQVTYRAQRSALTSDYRAGKISYSDYKKQWNALIREEDAERDYQARNLCGGGVSMLSDIYDALSGGTYQANGTLYYGHGAKYYSDLGNRNCEIFANYMSLSVNRPDLVDMLRKDKPDLCNALDQLIEEMAGGIK